MVKDNFLSLKLWLLYWMLLIIFVVPNPLFSADETEILGPLVGHTATDSVILWARIPLEGDLVLTVHNPATQKDIIVKNNSQKENDWCVEWSVKNLVPDTEYEYWITLPGTKRLATKQRTFKTAPSYEKPGNVSLAFGSCAYEDGATASVWQKMLERSDAIVLLGDTPYIDKTNLQYQRKRYRDFIRDLLMTGSMQNRPIYSIWDDHDFGRNDTDGNLKGKWNSRRAFVEYHANPSYGDGREGIYTKFRRGPMEVFLLDTRYFAATESSEFNSEKPSLLGKGQWNWLRGELKNSTAEFKLLACGMIWNNASRPKKSDKWGAYPHELDGLYRFIGKHKIQGVVLVGGDVHRSRVIRHQSKSLAGYDLIELTSSPMHHRIIESANAPHPGLIKDMGTPNTFMLLTSEKSGNKSSLKADFIDKENEIIFSYQIYK